MSDVEETIKKAGTKEHKGNYGNTQGQSANSLYKKYKTWIEDQGKIPMDFKPWLKWAKEKGIITGNYNADAVTDEKKDDDVSAPVKSNTKKYVTVIIFGVAVLVLYSAFKSEDTK